MNNNWIPGRNENDTKTISQIHIAEREAREAHQVLMNMLYSKRIPVDKSQNLGVSEDDWTPTSKSNEGSSSIIDPSKLKLTEPDEVDSIRLGPGGRGPRYWFKGSSGGNKISPDSDVKTALINRSDASSCDRNSQLPPTDTKTSTSSEKESLTETVTELNQNVGAEPKPHDVKNDGQVNEKAADSMAALSLKGPELSNYANEKETKPLIDEFLNNVDSEKLGLTVRPTTAVPKTEMSLEEIKTKLRKLLESKEENEKIFDWIEAQITATTVGEPSFIRALAYEVHKNALTGTGADCELDVSILAKRIPLLNRYIDQKKDLELQTLYALQYLMMDLHQPKGVLRQIFGTLYDNGVITGETFKNWEQCQDPNEVEVKNIICLSVREFFTWLRETESGEDEI